MSEIVIVVLIYHRDKPIDHICCAVVSEIRSERFPLIRISIFHLSNHNNLTKSSLAIPFITLWSAPFPVLLASSCS
jgi:hypothetical protein